MMMGATFWAWKLGDITPLPNTSEFPTVVRGGAAADDPAAAGGSGPGLRASRPTCREAANRVHPTSSTIALPTTRSAIFAEAKHPTRRWISGAQSVVAVTVGARMTTDFLGAPLFVAERTC